VQLVAGCEVDTAAAVNTADVYEGEDIVVLPPLVLISTTALSTLSSMGSRAAAAAARTVPSGTLATSKYVPILALMAGRAALSMQLDS
jgi:hypothetical protein